jgi:hypothetical protein
MFRFGSAGVRADGNGMDTRDEGGRLVVTVAAPGLARLLLGLGVGCVAWALWHVVSPVVATDQLIGLVCGAATCLGGGLLLLEDASFAFDRATRTIAWRRRWAWSRRSGSLAFDAVTDVRVETPVGDEGVPSRRIVLDVAGARRPLPLTVGFAPDYGDATLLIARRIREALGRARDDAPADAAAKLARMGRTIEAIKLLRQDEDLSLAEAKRRVDEMRPRTS